MAIKRTILKKDKNIFVVRLNLEEGDFIPEHHSQAYVTATVTNGTGVFTIGNKAIELKLGIYLDMNPYDKHSIRANEPLELIVHHIALNLSNIQDSENLCSANIK